MDGVRTQLQAALEKPTSARHRWEMPMLWICTMITLAVLLLSAMAMAGFLPAELVEELSSDDGLDVSTIAVFAIFMPAFYFVLRYFIAAGIRANAIKVGAAQFPEIHARYMDIAKRIGLDHVPDLYIVNGNGVVNAYALSCNRRRGYVVVHAEIAQMYTTSPETVDFVLAHELAHHKLNHVSLWRLLIGTIPNMLFLPGKTLIRAQEYSADRLALCACPGTGDTTAMLAIGPAMARSVNPEAWLQQCCEEAHSPLVRLHNAISDHAVMTKRYKALKDIEAHGLSRHGAMF